MRPSRSRRAAVRAGGVRGGGRATSSDRGLARSLGDASLAPFRLECDAAIEPLRLALRSLAQSAGCDLLRPQEVSRSLGLNKNLTWKIARLLGAGDSFEAISMMPGTEGIEIFLRAFAAARVDAARVEAARGAFAALEQVIARHFGDRGQLELMLDAVRSDGNLENSRRLAFRGMSGVFGVQAKVRLTAQIISPSTDPEHADISLILGLVGLQRLRPRGRLPVFKWTAGADRSRPSPLFPSGSEDEFLVREFSSFPSSKIQSSSEGGRHVVELSEGPLGKLGAADLYFGSIARAVMQRRGTPENDFTEFVTAISVPAESLVSDLFVHESVGGLETLETSVHSILAQPLAADVAGRDASQLPLDAEAEVIEDLAEGFGLPAVPRYEEMIGRAMGVLGQDLRDHRLVRVAMPFPPVPAALLVRWRPRG